MATRDYWAVFGSGAPSTKSGLAPTFITFITATGANGTPPAITEPGSKGLYKFSYDASATMISFVLDGATTGLSTSDRYVVGVLDPQDTFGVTLNAFGVSLNALSTTMIAQGATIVGIGASLNAASVTLGGIGLSLVGIAATLTPVATGVAGLVTSVGSTASSIGSTSVDPGDIYGFLKRAQEFQEGNQTYTKATGILDYMSRGNTLIAEKTISDTATETTRT